MKDYKSTLNLTQTAFPMKANLAQREPGMLKRWQEMDLYQQICKKNAGKKKFILHDGPPYANGDLHLGHAVNKILKDIIIKSKLFNGFDAPYIPGWDCHGLPIEHNVEKKKGKAGQKISYADFRKACRDYAHRQVENQKKDFIRMGVFGDWDNPYLTMNYETEANIVRSLGKIVENGHLVKGFKPVYWSVVGGSALAEAEVEYQDKTSFAIDVRFPVVDREFWFQKFSLADLNEKQCPLSVVIWTTTPWTLPSNQAVSFNSKLSYALVECNLESGTELIIIAQAMVDEVMNRYGCSEFKILGVSDGASFENQKLNHPFMDKQVGIVLGDHVTTEAGTGAVHTAPDHGMDDFIVGAAYGLGTLNLVNENGVFTKDAGHFAGVHVYKADEKVIELLKENSALIVVDKIVHSYAHCWRTKTPLIYRATPQWFISMTEKNLVGSALNAVKDIGWVPDWGQARIELMLKGSPDWCVSRQRTWGVPITLFVHKETQQLHPDTSSLIEQVALRIEKEGIEAWFELQIEDLLGEDAQHYNKVTDTLDVWFDSGVTHYSVVDQRDELTYPADLYLEGSDQHRGWFQSSLKTAIAMNGTAPYKQVLTHGFTVDSDGRKMSKSLGNTISPQQIWNESGADILRLWVAATDYRGEMSASQEILKRVADSYRRIRNTTRFMLSNLAGFDPLQHTVNGNEMLALDTWIVRRTQQLQAEVISDYDNYYFLNIYQKIHNFCSIELSSFYLDIIKDRQYTTQEDSLARRSAQSAMFTIVEMLSKLIAPILSFTADEIWQNIPGSRSDSVFLSEFSHDMVDLPESKKIADDDWQQLMLIKTAVNKELEKQRMEKVIGSSLNASVTLYCDDKQAALLKKTGDELRFVFIVSQIKIKSLEEAEESVTATEIEGLKVSVAACEHDKCERCWHHREDVGANPQHPTICSRCVENIDGAGEVRSFA